jgi:Fungal N-terminal domain of STAND proteins
MDPLSAVASVIAVLQISERIVSICKEYIAVIKDAPSDLRKILLEVGSIKSAFEVVEILASRDDDDEQRHLLSKLKGQDGPIEGCRRALAELEKLFPTTTGSSNNGKRQKLAPSLTTLAWPFKRYHASRLLDEISRYKLTISLALSAETL